MNYYEILGVNKNSNISEIKKAYRKLAMKWHPDKNINNKEEATKKFKEVTEAYDTLSDDNKRRHYDMFGKKGTNVMNVNPDEIFKSFFGANFFQIFENELFNNINRNRNIPKETVTKQTFINNGEMMTKIIKTKIYSDGTKKVTEEIIKNKIDASISNMTDKKKVFITS